MTHAIKWQQLETFLKFMSLDIWTTSCYWLHGFVWYLDWRKMLSFIPDKNLNPEKDVGQNRNLFCLVPCTSKDYNLILVRSQSNSKRCYPRATWKLLDKNGKDVIGEGRNTRKARSQKKNAFCILGMIFFSPRPLKGMVIPSTVSKNSLQIKSGYDVLHFPKLCLWQNCRGRSGGIWVVESKEGLA